MFISTILMNAATLCEIGWTRCVWEKTDERGMRCFCADGAIFEASGGASIGTAASVFFKQHLPEAPEGRARIPYWNDFIAKSQGEVVAKLREVALIAEKQGL